MNVHISYKSDKTAEIDREIQDQVEKLERRLQDFQPDLVHLHGSVAKGGDGGQEIWVSLNLRLPSDQLAAKNTSDSAGVAVRGAFKELTAQLDAHMDRLRRKHNWRRLTKEHSRVPFETTVASVPMPNVTDEQLAGFLNANADKLIRYVRREIRYRVAAGQLPPDLVTPEEVLDEAVANCMGERKDRPQTLALEPWFYGRLREAIDAVAQRNRGDGPDGILLEVSGGAAKATESSEAHEMFHSNPSRGFTSAEVIGDDGQATPEDQVAAEEMIAEIDTVLQAAKPEDRDAFVLFAFEGFTPEEIGEITGRPANEVENSIESARHIVLRRLPAGNMLKDRLAKLARPA